ncbi:hypothetical protein BJ166DRAFT_501993 [Pestalotiopsis sp. NC0098]|nr:hypothetical protein BJ166DRAFT_501993 [Pestalotiopsis sp. NC0098]
MSALVSMCTFTTSFGKLASREGWRAAVADAQAKEQKKTNSRKHSTSNSKCANGTCAKCYLKEHAKCYLKEHLTRHNKYQRLSEEGNGELTPYLPGQITPETNLIADGFGNW